MNEAEINTRLSALVVAMMAKGLVKPSAQAWIKADADTTVYLKWHDPLRDSYSADESKFITGKDVTAALSGADDYITSLPAPEKLKFDQFMKSVAKAVELGRANGMDVEFVNPLEKMMQDLSKNALAGPVEELAD